MGRPENRKKSSFCPLSFRSPRPRVQKPLVWIAFGTLQKMGVASYATVGIHGAKPCTYGWLSSQYGLGLP